MNTKVVSMFIVLIASIALTLAGTDPAVNRVGNGTVSRGLNQSSHSKLAPAQTRPEIRDAIAALMSAKAHMEHASHNFGGHRGAALKATDDAIRELLIAQQYDK